jgi:hypothetical protein
MRFSLLQSVQTDSGAHPASYPISTGGSFPRGRAARDMKLTIHLQLTPRSGMVEPYLHSPINLHGVKLNYCIQLLPFTFISFQLLARISLQISSGILFEHLVCLINFLMIKLQQ